jgi:hypothetical protein
MREEDTRRRHYSEAVARQSRTNIPSFASSRRIKLEVLFLVRVYFQKMSEASVLIQKARRGSRVCANCEEKILATISSHKM